jgi:hypothetical protein
MPSLVLRTRAVEVVEIRRKGRRWLVQLIRHVPSRRNAHIDELEDSTVVVDHVALAVADHVAFAAAAAAAAVAARTPPSRCCLYHSMSPESCSTGDSQTWFVAHSHQPLAILVLGRSHEFIYFHT